MAEDVKPWQAEMPVVLVLDLEDLGTARVCMALDVEEVLDKKNTDLRLAREAAEALHVANGILEAELTRAREALKWRPMATAPTKPETIGSVQGWTACLWLLPDGEVEFCGWNRYRWDDQKDQPIGWYPAPEGPST